MENKNVRTIGVLTSGGDAPGMNAAIRSVVRVGSYYGLKVFGVRRGYNGLINGELEEMNARSVSEILQRGGTILQTARCLEFKEEAGVKKAVEMAKDYAPFVRKIEVEVENLEMVKEAVEAGADIIMLDNMSTEEMQEAIKIIDGRAETECSGNMKKENIATITKLGVDYVSSGALTHSAPILDLSLKHLRAL